MVKTELESAVLDMVATVYKKNRDDLSLATTFKEDFKLSFGLDGCVSC